MRAQVFASPDRTLALAAALLLVTACASGDSTSRTAATPPQASPETEVAPVEPVEPVVWPVTRPPGVRQAAFALHQVVASGEAGSLLAFDTDGSSLALAPRAVVRSSDIARVELNLEYDLEHYAVTLYFRPEGAERLAAATRERIGSRVAVLVDGEVLFAPVIQALLTDSAMISNSFDRATATQLAERLAP
jgi:hypothetical protein